MRPVAADPTRIVCIVFGALVLAACGDGDVIPPDAARDVAANDGRSDVASDVATDRTVVDVSGDTASDVRADAPTDSGMDVVGIDALDGSMDANSDAPSDVSAERATTDAPDAADAGCDAGRMLCGSECVDLATDARHCGACGAACGAGESCVSGACSGAAATWSTNATSHDCGTAGTIGMRFTYLCPPGGTAGSVWGTGVYTHDSSVCTAAVHAGRISLATGGTITIEMRAGVAMYVGSMRNGISSNNYGSWTCSFAVVGPACASSAVACGDVCTSTATDPANCGACGTVCGAGRVCAAGACGCASGRTPCGSDCVDLNTDARNCGACGSGCAAGEVCGGGRCSAPTITWSSNATANNCATPGVIGSRYRYVCPPGGSAGSIWGTDVYTHDSSICTAAVHVGRITLATGGAVTIEMRAGLTSYTGSTRNGVTSSNYGSWTCSFALP